jgi:heme-degrading monooxygenase HmoA
MYVRSSRIQFPPEQLDAAIKQFKETTVPAARQAAGLAGIVLLVNRSTGNCVANTFWESRQALDASEELGGRLRTEAASAAQGSVSDVQRMEVVIREMAAPPKEGAFIRGNRGRISPDKADTLIQRMREEALPTVRDQRGFRALNVGVDRASGAFAIVSVWDTAADREASFGAIQEMRSRLFTEVGAQDIEVAEYESAHAEFAGAPAPR